MSQRRVSGGRWPRRMEMRTVLVCAPTPRLGASWSHPHWRLSCSHRACWHRTVRRASSVPRSCSCAAGKPSAGRRSAPSRKSRRRRCGSAAPAGSPRPSSAWWSLPSGCAASWSSARTTRSSSSRRVRGCALSLSPVPAPLSPAPRRWGAPVPVGGGSPYGVLWFPWGSGSPQGPL